MLFVFSVAGHRRRRRVKANRWEIKDFVSPEFCHILVKQSEYLGFVQATLDTQAGIVTRLQYRNNLRLTFDDQALADMLWDKLKNDPRFDNPGWTTLGLNERFKIYKYTDKKGHYFAQHFDGSYDRVPMVEKSWVTLLVYLNGDFEGGETSFMDGIIAPEAGLAALMTQHNVLHEALEVTKGTKYVLRSDVMYRKEGTS